MIRGGWFAAVGADAALAAAGHVRGVELDARHMASLCRAAEPITPETDKAIARTHGAGGAACSRQYLIALDSACASLVALT